MYCHNSAGFWVRFGAGIIDGLLMSIIIGIVTFNVYGGVSERSPYNIIEVLYNIIVPVIWLGYTVGKRVFGIRIKRVDGERLGFGTMFLRYIVGGLVYFLTLGIGVFVSALMVGLRSDNRAIHDFIAGTYVTYNPPEYDLK
ncbi:MAG: RDD family protein [Bacillus sp. (in: Bacteria)]|nr:RDD family protein [Bacillus sp. (in: firmicutes)]